VVEPGQLKRTTPAKRIALFPDLTNWCRRWGNDTGDKHREEPCHQTRIDPRSIGYSPLGWRRIFQGRI